MPINLLLKVVEIVQPPSAHRVKVFTAASSGKGQGIANGSRSDVSQCNFRLLCNVGNEGDNDPVKLVNLDLIHCRFEVTEEGFTYFGAVNAISGSVRSCPLSELISGL